MAADHMSTRGGLEGAGSTRVTMGPTKLTRPGPRSSLFPPRHNASDGPAMGLALAFAMGLGLAYKQSDGRMMTACNAHSASVAPAAGVYEACIQAL